MFEYNDYKLIYNEKYNKIEILLPEKYRTVNMPKINFEIILMFIRNYIERKR